jgi:hypothetical protein
MGGGRMMRKLSIRICFLPALALIVLLGGTVVCAQGNGGPSAASPGEPQVAEPPDGGMNWKGVGVGAGAVVTNLVYVPAKLVYGILGGIAGGAGYALTGGNKQVANSIWRSSLGGDYVLTPEMMTGKKPIYFSGPSEAGTAPAAASGTNSSPPNAIASTPAATVYPPVAGSDTVPASHPIDSGTGPVGATTGPRTAPYAGTNSPANGSRSYTLPAESKRSPGADTSVE